MGQMNLDDLTLFQALDIHNMIGWINGLPDQLLAGWELGQTLPLPAGLSDLRHVIIAGMGGSGIGADLLEACMAETCPLPIVVLRNYSLPAWVHGPETLVIASSHSGNTEETLAVFAEARARGCRLLALTTGGRLAETGDSDGWPAWRFVYAGPPRTAVGYTFGILLAAFFRLGLAPDPLTDLLETVEALRIHQKHLLPEVPTPHNPAKRMAGQLVDRWVVLFAADDFLPVARRWKGQISEMAKAWAQFEALPEADHNSLAGLSHPERPLEHMLALFLTAPANHPRNQLRLDVTRRMFMVQGINTDFIRARGSSRMAQLWTLLHMGDYIAYYLAMAYGEDPTPVDALTELKQELDDETNRKVKTA
jgi:glucose/mannose-6-phosphate isomerase